MLGTQPKPGETCLDLGASPGGWSYVLGKLGARVIAIDKAPLDARLTALPNVMQRQESAFALAPRDIGPVDWLFSDVICYPARLLTLVEKCIAAGTVKNFVCTIKFQGETDFATQARFAAIPGSRLMHLHVQQARTDVGTHHCITIVRPSTTPRFAQDEVDRVGHLLSEEATLKCIVILSEALRSRRTQVATATVSARLEPLRRVDRGIGQHAVGAGALERRQASRITESSSQPRSTAPASIAYSPLT